MTVTSESPLPRADPFRFMGAAAVGLVVFAFAWALLHGGPFDDVRIIDTPVYETYGDAMVRGEVPYRDFSLEYPPGALPVFLIPEAGSERSYAGLFEALMFLLGAVTVALVALTLASAGASDPLLCGGVLLTSVTPLLLGPLLLSRFDLWPAALVAAALAALVLERMRLGLGLLGAAVAVKIYPLVLLPLGILYVWRRRGRREALLCLGVFALVVVAIVGP
ncbi:MAG: glycosyltransferase 87 family protein, partial [Acidobacteriota bacterium]|nr:glycosyltransferase 87 family protein [Acidobacteriota bacterium]